jgi:hypothetical protein
VTSGTNVGIGGGTTTGATGLTTTQMTDGASYRTNFAGFDFDTVWAPAGNGFRPALYGVSGVVGVRAADATMTYGDAVPALGSPTYLGLGYWNRLTTAATLTTTANSTSNAGSYSITGSGAVGSFAGGASRIVYLPSTMTVTPRALTVTANNQSKAYGDANPSSGAATGNNLVNRDSISSVSLSSPATAASNVGAYDLTGSAAVFGSGLASNYAITYATSAGGLAVTPRAITVTAGAASRTYGDANPSSGAATGNNLVNRDSISSVSLSSPATAASNVGAYDLTGSAAVFGSGLASNYAITYAPRTGGLAVTPRAITVTADPQSRIYGDANPALSYSVGGRGLVNGDALSGALVTTATTTSNLGSYDITLGTLAAPSNYNLTYVGARPRPGTDTALLASSTVRDHFDALALPADAQPLFDTAPGTTAIGTGVFYADPRFDRIFVCFGGACFAVKS